jgi:hypothetical protein
MESHLHPLSDRDYSTYKVLAADQIGYGMEDAPGGIFRGLIFKEVVS